VSRDGLMGSLRVLLTACALATMPAAAQAQTGLVVITEGPGSVLHGLQWPYGPVHVAAWESGGRAAIDSLVRFWSRQRTSAVIVVPVTSRADSDLNTRLAFSGRVFVTSVVVRETRGTDDMARRVETAAAEGLAALVATGGRVESGAAQQLDALNVTATRLPRDGFTTPLSVTTFGKVRLQERTPNGVTDLFRDEPGLDIVGVGVSQPRPIIRGLEGQRILLLEDGVRLGNSRREKDRGELPGLVDVSSVERVEIVRGASSILYGSDAIGGVVNLHTGRPRWATSAVLGVRGRLAYRFSTVDRQHRATGSLTVAGGPIAARVSGAYRRAEPYSAPAGRYGNVTLQGSTRVEDSGVRDVSVGGFLGVRLATGHEAYARYERYGQRDAGFGFVEPEVLGGGEIARLQLLFPQHDFHKVVLGYDGTSVRLPVADVLSVVTYAQSNARDFVTNLFSPIGDTASVSVETVSFTDLDTYGMRLDASRFLGGRHTLTYGMDFFRDRSENTDTSTTVIEGLGPTTVSGRGAPRVPFASYLSLGVFAQADVMVLSRLNAVFGLRYQFVNAMTDSTPGLSEPLVRSSNKTVVGAANVRFAVTDHVALVASAGRGFRSPNLVERFFNGPSPEGRGFWIPNLQLKPERSWNLEAGVKVRSRLAHATAFVFQNTIRDGIAVEPTGNFVGRSAEYQNVNVDEIRFRGIEFLGGVVLRGALSVSLGFTHLSTADLEDSTVFVGETYRNKVTGTLRYDHPGGRFWAEYTARHMGARDKVDLGSSVVGDVMPPFTVHHVRAGARIFGAHRVNLAVENVTNTLYAEAPNVAFFRPEPRRNLIVSWVYEF